jgi:hypothetical protein
MTPTVDYQIKSAENLVVHTVRPGYSTQCLFDSYLARCNDPDYEQGQGILWHFTPGAAPLEFTQSSLLHAADDRVRPDSPSYRVALLTDDEAVFGSLRQYAAIGSNDLIQHNVFRDINKALDWLQHAVPDRT